jgi:hypothetical protein
MLDVRRDEVSTETAPFGVAVLIETSHGDII